MLVLVFLEIYRVTWESGLAVSIILTGCKSVLGGLIANSPLTLTPSLYY